MWNVIREPRDYIIIVVQLFGDEKMQKICSVGTQTVELGRIVALPVHLKWK